MPTYDQHELTRRALEIYERFGKPLEAAHRGKFVAISSDGRFVLAPDSTMALIAGAARFGSDNYIFRIGNIAAEVWK